MEVDAKINDLVKNGNFFLTSSAPLLVCVGDFFLGRNGIFSYADDISHFFLISVQIKNFWISGFFDVLHV